MMFFCVTLLILFSFMKFQSESTERINVIGPDFPLVAVAGEDLVLPCFIKPNTSAVDMKVEWLRLERGVLLVHMYEDLEDRNEKQAQSYKGRTSLFKEELQKGNASLRLSALQVSDEGDYKCLIEDKSWYDDITVHVTVEVLGSHPVITVESYDHSGGINLVCESRGWNPEPEVLWMNREGNPLPAEDTQIHRDTEGFSVKRRVTVYDYSDSNRFYCRLQQKHHMMETEVIINSTVFDALKPDVRIPILAVFIIVALMTVILLIVICQKKASELRKEKEYAGITVNSHKYAELQRHRVEDVFIKKMFAMDVTLDPDTAHPYLILSADGKQVTHGDERQDLPDTPQRFKACACVVGKQSFSSGRIYYEVQVRGKTAWTLGVIRKNINRKTRIKANPNNGFWIVVLRNENDYMAHDDPDVPLTLREKVEKVGVFVDYEEGLVSFYDVKASSHIYSFTGQCFTEELYPYFSPCNNNGGKNSAPLIITALNE